MRQVDTTMVKYRGLSTDTKPAAAPGSTFYEMNTGKEYMLAANGSWYEMPTGSGISDEAKAALLTCFRHTAWTDQNGSLYYMALANALNADTGYITAVFTQGSNVISSSDKLDDLRNFLVVKLHNGEGTSITVSDYALSGNLNSAESVITVTYSTYSATFTVNVTMLPSGYTAKTYVQTDGTQYITTTIPETEFATSGFRTKTMVPTLVDRAGHLFSSANLRAPYLFYYGSYNRKYINTNRYGNETRTGYTGSFNDWAAGTVYVIEGFMQGHDAVTLNGTKLYDCSAGSTSSSSNYMAIFTYYPQLSTETWRFRGNLYYIKAFNSDMTKQYDFVPCVNSSNVAGLYDLVHGVFYSPTVGTLATD